MKEIKITQDTVYKLISIFHLLDHPKYGKELEHRWQVYCAKLDALFKCHIAAPSEVDILHETVTGKMYEYENALGELAMAFKYYLKKIKITDDPQSEGVLV